MVIRIFELFGFVLYAGLFENIGVIGYYIFKKSKEEVVLL